MALSQAQYLLMLAEDARDQGDEIDEETRKQAAIVRARGAAHYHELDKLDQIVDKAKQIITQEKARFAQYIRTAQEASAGNAALQSGVPPHIVRGKVAEK
jgi:hypothetical protein